MAELSPTEPPSEPLVYRPISKLALTGFILAILFAGMVVISTLVALVQGLPVFLPGWALGLAVIAAVTCGVAQMHVRNAEGTIAGMALARWGLWLSVLLGVTYFVYVKVTGLALAKQANDFLMIKSDEDSGFFPRLKNAGKNRADLYQAFLLSLPTTSRGGSRAANEDAMLAQYDQPGKDGEPGNISIFSRQVLVTALVKNPDTIIIEPLGVVDWSYENNSYHVARRYRFKTPELALELTIPVQSIEGISEGEQRKWFVNMTRIPKMGTVEYTAAGENARKLRFDSKFFLENWRRELGQGAPAPAYKEADTAWNTILPKKEQQRAHVRRVLGEIFRGERRGPLQTSVLTDDYFADWSVVDGHVQVVHPFKLMLPPGDGLPSFYVALEFTVATKNPVNLDVPISLPLPWDIRKIRVTRVNVAPRIVSGG